MEKNSAALPYSYSQDEIVSALSKLWRHIYIFRNRRQFESLLELQLKASAMKPKLLTLDMLIQWNSTFNMINVACLQEIPITAVCATQTIDPSVHEIMLSQNDWTILC